MACEHAQRKAAQSCSARLQSASAIPGNDHVAAARLCLGPCCDAKMQLLCTADVSGFDKNVYDKEGYNKEGFNK
jgi:hypothetical protein